MHAQRAYTECVFIVRRANSGFYAEIAETYRVAEITEFFVSAARTVVLGRYNSVLSAT